MDASLYIYNTKDEVDVFVAALKETLALFTDLPRVHLLEEEDDPRMGGQWRKTPR